MMRWPILAPALFAAVLCSAQARNAWWTSDWLDGLWLQHLGQDEPAVVALGLQASLNGFHGTMSDTAGALVLYFTDGPSVRNAAGQLLGGAPTVLPGTQGTSSSILLPAHAGDRYGVFTTVKLPGLSWHTAGFYEVDMSLNGGAGAVLEPGITQLLQSVRPSLAATPHANGSDYWVVYRNHPDGTLSAFKYGPQGCDTVPVVSDVGTACPEDLGLFGPKLLFSTDGTWLATLPIGCDQLWLYRFNDSSGVISFYCALPVEGCHGLEFSPSGRYLYALEHAPGSSSIVQWDLSLDDPDVIAASITTVHNASNSDQLYMCNGMALAPDGRIYIPEDVSTAWTRIELPDLPGVACQVVPGAVEMGGGELTRFVHNHCKRYHDSGPSLHVAAEVREFGPQLRAYPNPASDAIALAGNLPDGTAVLRWLDSTGRVIRSRTIVVQQGRSLLDRTGLVPGVYVIELQLPDSTMVATRVVLL